MKLISKKIYSITASEEEEAKQEKDKIKDSNEFKKIIDGMDQTQQMNIKILSEIFELKEN